MTKKIRYSQFVWFLGLSVAAAGLWGCRSSVGPPPEHQASQNPPSLQGVWQVLNTAAWNIQDHAGAWDIPAGRGVVEGNAIPYQPQAAEQRRLNWQNRATSDPESKCYLPGVPRATYMPYPFHIFQTPKYVLITYEYAHAVRVIYTDGTAHPEGPLEFWMGDSRGRWEGDTLVVDVVHFTDKTWFDRAGNFHSDALHVIERYTPAGPDHIQYQMTVEDPKVFTQPWKMNMLLYRRKEPNPEILEYECVAYLEQESGARK